MFGFISMVCNIPPVEERVAAAVASVSFQGGKIVKFYRNGKETQSIFYSIQPGTRRKIITLLLY